MRKNVARHSYCYSDEFLNRILLNGTVDNQIEILLSPSSQILLSNMQNSAFILMAKS